MKEKIALDNDIMNRILELQVILKDDFGSDMSFDEILLFLEDAMNFGAFQIELLKYKLENVSLSYVQKLRLFFDKNDNDDILRLYRITQNFNDVNIESIEERLSDGVFDNSRDNGPVKVKVNKKSMEILAKAILR